MKENWIIKGVMWHGLSQETKTCIHCKRANHKDNTHCWYCNLRFGIKRYSDNS